MNDKAQDISRIQIYVMNVLRVELTYNPYCKSRLNQKWNSQGMTTRATGITFSNLSKLDT